MEIVSTTVFIKKARKLMSSEEIRNFEDELSLNPDKWPVVQGTGGIRKARASKSGSGKSGGATSFLTTTARYYFSDGHLCKK